VITRLEKPLVAIQLDRALELVCRVRDNQLICVFIYGPKGIGKTEIVKVAYRESIVHLESVPDATLHGMRQLFLANPAGHYWLDDNDQWLKHQHEVNFLKRVLQGGNIEAINANTLRASDYENTVNHVKSHIRLIVTSNARLDALSTAQRNHVEAVIDRGERIDITTDPPELLKFLDWWIVEQNYFATDMFRAEANINRSLSLREIQDVLNFIHAFAWQLPLSLRMIRQTAVERVMSPNDWKTKLRAGLLPPKQLTITPPPAPQMFGRNVREGLPIKPTGYERRLAKRMQRIGAGAADAADPSDGRQRAVPFP
jgi:hypothetical protein